MHPKAKGYQKEELGRVEAGRPVVIGRSRFSVRIIKRVPNRRQEITRTVSGRRSDSNPIEAVGREQEPVVQHPTQTLS